MGVKIVLAGPPRSGKSCLREGLKGAIMALGGPYPLILTACPDGEGAWFQQTVARDATEARRLKEGYKAALGGFSPEFVKTRAEWVARAREPLVLVDIGGIPSPENRVICRHATHAVLLAGDDPKTGQEWNVRLEPWRAFFAGLGIPVCAVVRSDYHGTADHVSGVVDGVFYGAVHYLERGEDIASRPAVRALAEHLIQLAREAGWNG